MTIRIGGNHSSLLMKIDGLEAYGKPKALFAQPLRCVVDGDVGDLKVVIGKFRGHAALDAADSAAGRIDQHHFVIIIGELLAEGIMNARLGVDVELECSPVVQRREMVVKAGGEGAFSNTEDVSKSLVDKIRESS